MALRCATCGATNPDGARFCGQCYEVFTDDGHQEPTPPAAPPEVHTPPAPAGQPGAVQEGTGGQGQVAVGRFSSVDGELVWRCGVCNTVQPATTYTCDVCGARMDAESDAPAQSVDWDAARRRERTFPGMGHLAAGQVGMGAARSGIAALWVLGAAALTVGGVAGLLTAVPLLLGLVLLWVSGPGDLDAARTGTTPRLDARRFMYTVLGVTAGVIVLGGLSALL